MLLDVQNKCYLWSLQISLDFSWTLTTTSVGKCLWGVFVVKGDPSELSSFRASLFLMNRMRIHQFCWSHIVNHDTTNHPKTGAIWMCYLLVATPFMTFVTCPSATLEYRSRRYVQPPLIPGRLLSFLAVWMSSISRLERMTITVFMSIKLAPKAKAQCWLRFAWQIWFKNKCIGRSSYDALSRCSALFVLWIVSGVLPPNDECGQIVLYLSMNR